MHTQLALGHPQDHTLAYNRSSSSSRWLASLGYLAHRLAHHPVPYLAHHLVLYLAHHLAHLAPHSRLLQGVWGWSQPPT
jgi:hypothetical protein